VSGCWGGPADSVAIVLAHSQNVPICPRTAFAGIYMDRAAPSILLLEIFKVLGTRSISVSAQSRRLGTATTYPYRRLQDLRRSWNF
jgi:hypothetical protein